MTSKIPQTLSSRGGSRALLTRCEPVVMSSQMMTMTPQGKAAAAGEGFRQFLVPACSAGLRREGPDGA